MSQRMVDQNVPQREHSFTDRELVQQIENLYHMLLARAHSSSDTQNDHQHQYLLYIYFELKELINFKLDYYSKGS
jgi:hypothetical protein